MHRTPPVDLAPHLRLKAGRRERIPLRGSTPLGTPTTQITTASFRWAPLRLPHRRATCSTRGHRRPRARLRLDGNRARRPRRAGTATNPVRGPATARPQHRRSLPIPRRPRRSIPARCRTLRPICRLYPPPRGHPSEAARTTGRLQPADRLERHPKSGALDGPSGNRSSSLTSGEELVLAREPDGRTGPEPRAGKLQARARTAKSRSKVSRQTLAAEPNLPAPVAGEGGGRARTARGTRSILRRDPRWRERAPRAGNCSTRARTTRCGSRRRGPVASPRPRPSRVPTPA